MKLSTLDRLAIALFAAQLAAAIGVGLNGPTHLIPSHFDFQGQVDGWTDRTGLAVAIAGMAVIGLLISLGLGLAVARAGDPGRRRGLTAAQAVATFLFPACAALLLFMGLGAPVGISDHSSQLMIGISLLMLGAGAVMGRVGPNPFVGVRTPWAYKSRLAWDRSNRLIGRLWLLGGPDRPGRFALRAPAHRVSGAAGLDDRNRPSRRRRKLARVAHRSRPPALLGPASTFSPETERC
jgi:uncharacterized membrane protein